MPVRDDDVGNVWEGGRCCGESVEGGGKDREIFRLSLCGVEEDIGRFGTEDIGIGSCESY